jgi:cardiolipin synthase
MLAETRGTKCAWLCTGHEFFAAILAAIDAAEESVCLETYTYAGGPFGERFREALVGAAQRGVRVRVMTDALGSYTLPADFFKPLWEAGGESRVFNPLSLGRLGIRNHRKLLVCDERVAFVGGFNIAPEFDGDGITKGWRDLGLMIEGPLAAQLAESFDEMWERADFQHKFFIRLRKSGIKKAVVAPHEQLLLSGPGREPSPIKRALSRDLNHAASAQIMVAYFLPTWRLRRQIAGVVRRGGHAQLILAAKSDVAVSLLAARSLYRRLLKAGVSICEYQPQVLHAKLLVIDDAVYVGSANLDQRSLNLNYELMVRIEDKKLAAQARDVLRRTLDHCHRMDFEEWRKSRSFWQRLKQRWAYFLLVRIDPFIAQRQWHALPD